MTEPRRVLMIAYHFPPVQGSSGVQRTLRFARWLPQFGWQPAVLTVHVRAYERVVDDPGNAVPVGLEVRRAQAFDAARHFAVSGRYPRALALPDRWSSWWLGAVPAGLALARRLRPHAIWSTYPIATAHRIGATLQRWTGLPWVADFRDPMAQDGYPPDPRTWRSFRRVEDLVFARASACVFTTPSSAAMYRARYPERADRIRIIENGYDEEAFAGLASREPMPTGTGPVTLLHSGLVYPDERNPRPLLEALGQLVRAGRVSPADLRLRFRAPGSAEALRAAAASAGVLDMVEIAPPVGYREALQEMLLADALLVLQGANCNEQIPAKLYEYLRAGRPILGLADPRGDTGRVLAAAGVRHLAPLESVAAIADTLPRFLEALRGDELPKPDGETQHASRRERAAELAAVLDGVAGASRRLPVRP